MESEIFKAGIAPGSPVTEDEIKMLLCYVLSNIKQPISFSQLYDALSENNMVNYFELVHVLDKLVKFGHIAVRTSDGQPESYESTCLGNEAGREFERTIPFTVREKALAASRRVLDRDRRLTEVKIAQTPCENGFLLELTIPDPGAEFICVRVFLPTEKDCELVRRRFLNAPLTIYKGIMALITGDEAVLGEIFTKEEPLF